MNKRQAEKVLGEIYMNVEETIEKLNERMDLLNDKESLTEEQEEELNKLNDVVELLKELKEKIEE